MTIDPQIRASYELGLELNSRFASLLDGLLSGHQRDDVGRETVERDLATGVLGVEGPGWLLGERVEDELVCVDVVTVGRAIEREPTIFGASGHLLAVAHRP